MSIKREVISAIESKNIKEVSKLLEQIDVGEVNKKVNGETALHVACRSFNNEALDLLLSKPGIDVNVRSWWEMTPLHTACFYNNDYAASKILITPHVDVNVQDIDGWTPLHYACCLNHHQMVSALLASPDIHVNLRSNIGFTSIMYSAGHCLEEALRLMLEDPRVDLDSKDNGEGLDVQVGIVEGSKELKEKCLEIINNARMKREKRQINEITKDRKKQNKGKVSKPYCALATCPNKGRHKCSRCKAVFYCHPECLSVDWPHHKMFCDYVFEANKVPNDSTNKISSEIKNTSGGEEVPCCTVGRKNP